MGSTRIRKNDTVVVIAGNDAAKKKTGKVLLVDYRGTNALIGNQLLRQALGADAVEGRQIADLPGQLLAIDDPPLR